MVTILTGTDRIGSRSSEIALILKGLYDELKAPAEIMELRDVGLTDLEPKHYGEGKPAKIEKAVDHLLKSDGLHLVVPEYNGSMPGALKLFIDHWKFPDSFEHRAVSFVGLGGRFGALRPVEHLQQVFGYRNSFIYPDRVFLTDIWTTLKDGELQDETAMALLKDQTQGFCRFIQALKGEKLLGSTPS